MTNGMTIVRGVLALVVAGGVQLPSSGLAQDFPAVVTEILQKQTEGPISQMGETKKAAVIACVNTVLADLPRGRKRYVLEGADFEEREHRFGRVVDENQAEWKQKIARSCADVALARED